MKFSQWLTNSHIPHDLTKVKGGYVLRFTEPDDELKELISSLFIMVDTGEEVGHTAVRKPVNIYTSNGDAIVIDDKHYAEILGTVQPVLFQYVRKKGKTF